MKKVAKFEKVSFKEFFASMKREFDRFTDYRIGEIYDSIQLPERATSGSAGYDIRTPFEFNLAPGETIKIPTGIRVNVKNGWYLGCYPRSGLGFKYRLQLDNTIGVVDSDYYYSDNEGHIFLKMTNDTHDNKTISVARGDKIAQGILTQFGITYDDKVKTKRNGGFGSTGK